MPPLRTPKRSGLRRPQLHTGTLANGLSILHHEVGMRVAYAAVLVGVGSRDESQREHGLSHLIEHMLFKGTRRRRAYQIANRLENVGGELNAYTSKEETVVHSAFLPEYLGRALELMADVVCHAEFPEHELVREKEVVLEEIASYDDAPAELIYDNFEELVFGTHPLAHGILGTPTSVRRLDRAAILNYIGRLYVAPRIALATCGPFPFSRVRRMAESLFSDLHAPGESVHRHPFTPGPAQCLLRRKRTAQAHCMVGAHAYPMGHDRGAALAMLTNLLGGYATSSRLNRTMREQAGLAYTVECTSTAYTDTGLFTVYFGTDPQHVGKAFGLLWDELRRVRTERLSTLQLHTAKRQFVGQLYLSAENMEGNMLANARRLVEGLPLATLENALSEIEAITAQDILEVANELLDEGRLFTLIYH